jgi:hypothetical protein
MELYHLTAQDQDVIDAIEQEGLRPGPYSWHAWGRAGAVTADLIGDVVWFIDDPTFKQWEGFIAAPIGFADIWRVVCDIPAQDRNLIRLCDCLCFQGTIKPTNFIHRIWVYAGVVPPSRITAIELLGSQSNWEVEGWKNSLPDRGG